MKDYYDVIIVGTGAAGLYCALSLPERIPPGNGIVQKETEYPQRSRS